MHFFVPEIENQYKNRGATYTRRYVKWPAKITTNNYENMPYILLYLFASAPLSTYLINVIESQ